MIEPTSAQDVLAGEGFRALPSKAGRRRDGDAAALLVLLRWGLLFVFVAMMFGDGMFRIPGIGKGDGVIGLILSAIRGVIFYSSYAGCPLVAIYLLFARGSLRRFRWISLWPVLLLVTFMVGMSLVSSARKTVEYRADFFLLFALPAMASMVHCTDLRGIELVRRWIIGAAGLAIVIILLSGRFVPLLAGDMVRVNWAADELGVENAERFVLVSNPITTAMIFYLAALAGLSQLLDIKRWWSGAVVLIITLISIGLGLATGARGPMVAFIVAVIALVAFCRLSVAKRLMAGILSCLLFLSSLALLPQVSPESAKRTFGILGQVIPALDLYGTSDRDAEAAGRYARYEEAISAPLSLFGRGVGAYGEYARDPTDYVHNLALEAYYETGAVGIAVIGVVFFYCLAGLLRFALKGRNLALFCLVGLIFYLTDAQFSGTLIHDVGSLCFLVVGCMAIGVEKHLERVDRANADGGIGARSGSRGRSIQQSPQFRRMSGGNFFGRSNDRG